MPFGILAASYLVISVRRIFKDAIILLLLGYQGGSTLDSQTMIGSDLKKCLMKTQIFSF